MTTKSKTQDKHKMSEIDENISKLFDIKKRLGKGAYGIVWKALDKRTNETLAVKKIFDAFRDETDAQRTFREIIFLKAFRNHPNVIKLNNVYKASNNLDIYLIFEYMESDLHNIIKKGTILKDIHKRYVMYQLINAIKYIHSGNVIHRDLKPSNVLIDSKCRCKLADFGLARSVSNRPMRDGSDIGRDPVVEPLLTDYVATRWYRAPEILVASKRYTKGIDMWSLGCILGEMIRGKPLFQGSSTVNQIEKIVTALPDITERDINAVGAGFGSVLLSKQISTERKTSLDELLVDAPDDATSLVKSLLVLDPLSRLTAKQALCHPYVEKFRNSIQEIELKMDILPPFRDDVRLSVPEYRSKLYEIVQVTGEKHNIPRNSVNGKNVMPTKQRDPKKELSSNYCEKPDILKKSSKTKQQIDNYDKYISKEQYLIKTEKYEREIQTNSSTVGKPPIKKAASPLPKRKQSKTIKAHPTEHKETPQISDKLNNIQPRSKVRYKSSERTDDAMKIYPVEKRHSIDCGYGSLPVGVAVSVAKLSPTAAPNTNSINIGKVDCSNRVYKSSSSLHRSGYTPHNRTAAKETQADQNERHYHRSTPIVGLENRALYVRNTKSDVIRTPTKNHDRVCYEKRLKKLEEEIEKYKKEVKTFCKESYRYNHDQTSDVGKVIEQSANMMSHSHSKLAKNGIAAKSAVNLPNVISSGTSHTPKKNPYYQLLSKGNREFERNEYDLQYSTGGSGDHIGRSVLEKLSRNEQRNKLENNHRVRPMSKFI